MTTTAEISELTGELAAWIEQVQAGNEVLFTNGNRPVAKLVPAVGESAQGAALKIRSIKGHRVLAPVVSQADLAEEMFGPR